MLPASTLDDVESIMDKKTKRLAFLTTLFAVHGIITAIAMAKVGFIGIFELGLANWGAGQVFSDLCVSLLLVSAWMLADGRARGIAAWPFVVVSPALGSIAPLAYLIWRELRKDAPATSAAAAHA